MSHWIDHDAFVEPDCGHDQTGPTNVPIMTKINLPFDVENFCRENDAQLAKFRAELAEANARIAEAVKALREWEYGNGDYSVVKLIQRNITALADRLEGKE
jgi:hypothetical protein